MGETGDAGCLPQDPSRQEYPSDPSHSFPTGYPDPSLGPRSSEYPQDNVPQSTGQPFFSQYSSIPHVQQAIQGPRPGNQPNLAAMNVNPRHDSSFSMAGMTEALPGHSGGLQGQGMQQRPLQTSQPPLSGASTSALVYQLQQISQYPGQAASAYSGQLGVNTAYVPSAFPNVYSQRSPGRSPTQQSYPQVSSQNQPYYYYPNQYGQTNPSPTYVAHPSQMTSPYDRSFSAPQGSGFGQHHPYVLQQQARMGPPTGIPGMGPQISPAGSIGKFLRQRLFSALAHIDL